MHPSPQALANSSAAELLTMEQRTSHPAPSPLPAWEVAQGPELLLDQRPESGQTGSTQDQVVQHAPDPASDWTQEPEVTLL